MRLDGLVDGLIATTEAAYVMATADYERAHNEEQAFRDNLPQALADCNGDAELLEGVKGEWDLLNAGVQRAHRQMIRLGEAIRSLRQANGYKV